MRKSNQTLATSFHGARCPRHGLKEGLSAKSKSIIDRSRVDSVLSADTAAPRRATEQRRRLQALGQSSQVLRLRTWFSRQLSCMNVARATDILALDRTWQRRRGEKSSEPLASASRFGNISIVVGETVALTASRD